MSIRKQITLWGACTALFFAGASPAAAAVLQLRAYLNGTQVPTASAETGVGTVTFDTSSKLLSWSVTFSGLTGAFTDAHFHGPAPAGTNAAIVVPMTGTTSPLTGSATLTDPQAVELLSGQWYINIHSATFPSGEIRGQVRRVTGDLDGDGKADLLWRHETTGTVLGWLMNGTSIATTGSPATVADAGWQLAGRGDFDGDGKTDLLWMHADGSVYVWLMNGNTILGTGSPAGLGPNSGWVVQGVGDFNGDGKADVLWKHIPTGQIYIWLMNGTSIASAVSPTTVADLDWQVQGVGDFNGDGKSDVLWLHADGSAVVWLMNGVAIASSGSPGGLGPNSGWEVRGVGDFDGDGKADILWKHTTSGTVQIWQMNGTSIAGTGSPATVGDELGGWHVMTVGDFNGDGRADIFWRNLSSGLSVVWLMNGTSIGSSGSPAGVADLLWTTQGGGANRWASLVGGQIAANTFASTITSNGANLATGHLTPLFTTGYLNDGFSATQDAGEIAGDLRGLAIDSLVLNRLIRFDAVNQAAFITTTMTATAPGPVTVGELVTEQNGGLGFKRQSNGTWMLYGNQRPGEIGVHTEMRTDSFPNFQSGPRQHVNVDIRTLQNLYTAVTIDGGALYSNLSIAKSTGTEVMTVQASPSPASPLTYLRDEWFTGADSALSGPATFTLTLTPASGPAVTRKVLSNAVTTKSVTITSPTVHTIETANLGNPLNVSWTLPAFTVTQVKLSGRVRTAQSPSPGFECFVDDLLLGTTATSGQITLPNACNGQSIVEAAISVAVDGSSDERTIYHFGFTPGIGLAPGTVALGSAATFGIMATSAITNTGNSIINGNVSLDPGTSMTGFPPGVVNGAIHINDTQSAQARNDLLSAYNIAKTLPPGTPVSAGADLGALFPFGIPPGTYTSGSTMMVSTPLVLDAGGNANAVWVFQIGSSLTTTASVLLANSAQAKNVFWVPTQDATIGVGTTFHGTIVSGRDVTAVTGATINGRILAGAITAGTIALQGNVVNVPAP